MNILKFPFLLICVIFLINQKYGYSYNTYKIKENESTLKSYIPKEDIDTSNINHLKVKHEKNHFKNKKYNNRLYNTLYPTEENKDYDFFNNHNTNTHKSEQNSKHAIPNFYNDNMNNSMNKISDVVNKDEINNVENFDKSHENNFTKTQIDKETVNQNDNYATENKKGVFEIFGNNEKVKSESKFGIFNYLKSYFEKSPYIKNFYNFVEMFFNKYDQRVLESTTFFNFDEILF
ncbi:conserved Plasmodium protein, unknown function [Plasmodium berghei]|uniref:Fam-c protein n=2 Tax=Plasmodium berghei TaxID=5821 RepID=A0A509AG01_PLABA|nr:conserved Plasmodium protein, unknown function [Plasmodium berghei ANKA]CXI03354.1 conserved Plasmodium protein, unknown function [Plasmodium berghei]SCL92090.1 conserved Plasmodium protein, unknown function [Plasmodium berghei]SCM15592.1 conserved Plasmodium protein, unknown function [Plasmodium berghei]SCM17384.1 conserved Plasmodium protein, unknown function [Plasmodium berghei]SCN22641.1 conserved Plasmodium protein, unknown function [Plasmodium berghei]|eukprot:XP_034420190.1 conserved Plasmodium protein, unknown function [Plasmodium berghei ANKA]